MPTKTSPENALAKRPKSLNKDIITGAAAIAAFLGEPKRRVFYLCSEGIIPAGRLGGRWVASKTRLREHYEKLTGGGAAT